MKIRWPEGLAATFVLVSAALASAGEVWVNSRTRDVRWTGRPPAVLAPWGEYRDLPSDEFLSRCDWAAYSFDCPAEEAVVSFDGGVSVRCKTQAELDAEAEEARLEAERLEAERLAPVPFPNGIVCLNGVIYLPSVPGASNGWAVATSPEGDLLTSHWYGSPTSTVSEIQADLSEKAAAKAAARAAIRAAKEKGNGLSALAERVAALEAERGVE